MHISFSNISQLSIFRCEAYLLSTTFYPLFSFVTLIIQPSSLFKYNYNFLPFLIHLICSPSVLKFNFPLNPKVRLRWEFIKENKKVWKQENTNLTKKAIKKTRKQERKQELDQESDQVKKKKNSFFLDHFLGRVLVFLFSFINSTSVWVR